SSSLCPRPHLVHSLHNPIELINCFSYTPSQISDLSTPPIKHHLYADDTQLYISFSPSGFSSAQSILMKTVDAIFQWMTSNFLTLNPSKTEFLLIGLPQQLTKLTHTHLILSDNTTIS